MSGLLTDIGQQVAHLLLQLDHWRRLFFLTGHQWERICGFQGEEEEKTPSSLKRDARRRDEFLKKKLEVSTGDASLPSENVSEEEAVGKQAVENDLGEKAFKCDQCDSIFKSENGLKIHVGKSHKKVNPMHYGEVVMGGGTFASYSDLPTLPLILSASKYFR